MTDQAQPWPTEAEIEADRRRRWRALSPEERLEFLENFTSQVTEMRLARQQAETEPDQ